MEQKNKKINFDDRIIALIVAAIIVFINHDNFQCLPNIFGGVFLGLFMIVAPGWALGSGEGMTSGMVAIIEDARHRGVNNCIKLFGWLLLIPTFIQSVFFSDFCQNPWWTHIID